MGPTLGPGGVWYPGGAPPSEPGGWRRMGRALAAPFRWMGGVSKRAITSLPWLGGGGVTSQSTAAARALQLIPLFACVRILADSIASLPVQTYRRNGASREMLTFVPSLLFAPAARDNLFEWLHKCVVSLALRGNAYGLITQRDDFGFPTMIEWLNPDDVWVDELRPTLPVFYWQGIEVPREQIVHIPWVVMPGKVVGLSPVSYFAHTIGVGLSATEYGLSWFDNGGTPPSVLKNSAKTITPDESAEISDRLSARVRARKPLVLGSDWDFEALKVSPEESQFIETMRLNASQIAAIYGVPPEMVGGDSGGSMTYANVEQNAINFVGFTLRPWLARLEAKLSALMPGKEFVRFNVDAMIRVDLTTRYQAHSVALRDGWRNRDEIRAIEDLSPLPPGQHGETYMPVALLAAAESQPDEEPRAATHLSEEAPVTDTERRFTKVPVELRAQADRKTIGGYAAVFNRQSSNLGGFVEVVDPAAFNASRGDGWPDVIARYNHDDNMLLGSTGSGTLRIMVDGTGLDYEVDPPKARADILELVQRGDVRKSSFAFRTIEDQWDTTDQGFPMRTLLRVQLVDVAPVNTPAYPDSTAGLRSLARHMHADFEEVRKLADADELRKFFTRTDRTGKPVVQEKTSYGAAARMALLARKTDPYA